MSKGKKLSIWIAALLCTVGAVFAFCFPGYLFFGLTLFSFAASELLLVFLPKRGKRVVLILLLVGLAVFSCFEIPIALASRGDAEQDADYVIVLGALLRESGPSESLRERLNAALNYMTAHPDCVAVLSGGQGYNEPMPEAVGMAEWLKDKGIPEQRLLLETESTSTAENLVFSLSLIGEQGESRIGIVSSEYHLYRAKEVASDLGVDAFGIPAHTARPVLRLNYFIREVFALLKYRCFS